MDGFLHGRCALVTGSTSGIGLAIARELAGEGAKIALCGRRSHVLNAAVRVPTAEGSNVTWKVVVPPAATVAAGCVVTVKSAACVPLTATRGEPDRFSVAVPVLRIV